MAPRTRGAASGKSQLKLEELPGTKKPVSRKRKAKAAPEASEPAEQRSKTDAAEPAADHADSTDAQQTASKEAAGDQEKTKLADDNEELQQIADKQQNAEAAEKLKTHTHQPTLESMPNTEGDPGPPSSAPDAGPRQGGAAGHSKPANIRQVDNPEVQVNRAPVITLWVAAVAQRQGFSRDAALTFGKYISGMLAQSKGRAIGIYEDNGKSDEEQAETRRQEEEAGVQRVDVFGMTVKAVKVGDELRAAETNNKAANPKATQGYLQRAFGDRLDDVEGVFRELADSFSPEDAAAQGYKLYEKFRPSVPQGQRGWGAKGVLDLQYVLSLSSE